MTDAPEAAEYSRPFDIRQISEEPVVLTASDAELAALAARFGLVAVKDLLAKLSLQVEGAQVTARGSLTAKVTQSCAVSGEDLPIAINEALAFRFVPDEAIDAEEVELEEEELDDIAYDGTSFDLGEAIAQSLVLAIDPYATGPQADAVRVAHDLNDEEPSGPLADALKALKKD